MPTSSPEALVSVSCHGTPSQPSKGTLQPSNAWILVCIVGTHPMLFVTLDLLWAPGIVDPPYYSLRDIVVPKTLRDQLCSFSKHISVLCHPVLNAHSPTRSPPWAGSHGRLSQGKTCLLLHARCVLTFKSPPADQEAVQPQTPGLWWGPPDCTSKVKVPLTQKLQVLHLLAVNPVQRFFKTGPLHPFPFPVMVSDTPQTENSKNPMSDFTHRWGSFLSTDT